jgi:hypothetical protein
VNVVPIRLVTYAYPMPAAGSAKPREPPDPGEPNERGLPKRHARLGFMKPSENCTSPFRHSSKNSRYASSNGELRPVAIGTSVPSSASACARVIAKNLATP